MQASETETSEMQISGLSFADLLNKKPGEYLSTPEDATIDPGLEGNPKALAALALFRKGLSELAEATGATFGECDEALKLIAFTAAEQPAFLYMFFENLMSPAFRHDSEGATPEEVEGITPEDMEGPVYYPGAPEISNPGVLPMRPDEPGTPMIVSGQVRSTEGTPLAGAEMDIWLAALTGHYSQTGLDDQPIWNLRGRLFTDEDGRYEFRAIVPVPYYIPVIPEGLLTLLAALRYSHFRASHIHVKIRHPELEEEFMTQLYRKDDPYTRYDSSLVDRPDRDALKLELEMHDDPGELAERGLDKPFATVVYDFVLKGKPVAVAS